MVSVIPRIPEMSMMAPSNIGSRDELGVIIGTYWPLDFCPVGLNGGSRQ